MINLLRTGALIIFICLLSACSDSSSSSPDSVTDTRNSETPDNEEPSEPTPVINDLTTNVFFPVYDHMLLYYDAGSEPAVLGETQTDGEVRVYPLQHSDERTEYLTSTPGQVGLKGLTLRLIDGVTPVYLDLTFDNVRAILGSDTSYSTRGEANVSITGIAGTYPVPVTLAAQRVDNTLIEVAGWHDQPARQIHLELRLTVNILLRAALLYQYPWAEPLLDAIELDMWFVPGVGIARIQQGNWQSSLSRVEGIPQPHVFDIGQNVAVDSVEPLQMQIDNEVLTDSEWQRTVFYRTSEEDWLDVSFDATGSWRARLTRTDLAQGIHAATVRFTRDGVSQDTTVSMLVR